MGLTYCMPPGGFTVFVVAISTLIAPSHIDYQVQRAPHNDGEEKAPF